MGKNTKLETATMNVKFVTATNTFSLFAGTSAARSDDLIDRPKGNLTDSIVSIQTTNDMADDAGAFKIILTTYDNIKWDRVLTPNDIVTIQANPGHEVENDYIMVGMIDTVKRVNSYADSKVYYQIEGKSMMNALMQVKLGTLQELMSMIGSFGWMMGMGGLKAANEQGADTAEERKAELIEKEKGKTEQEKEEQQTKDAERFKKVDIGVQKNVRTAKLLDIMFSPVSGKKPTDLVDKQYKGVFVSPGLGIEDGQEVNVPGYGTYKAILLKSKPTLYGGFISGDIFITFGDSDTSQYEMKYTGKQTIELVEKKSTSQKETDKKPTEEVNNETVGLVLSGKTAHEVAGQIINWFLNIQGSGNNINTNAKGESTIKYEYADPNRPTLADWLTTELSSRSEDEFLTDPTPIMSFVGSLRKLLDEVTAKPYNELYSEFTPDGKMSINMRRTPFEPEDWNKLKDNAVVVGSEHIIESSVELSNKEAFSIFSSSMPSSVLVPKLNSLMMFPVYYPRLTEQYGYSMYQQENPYIFMTNPAKNKTGGGSEDFSSLGSGYADTEKNARAIADFLVKEGYKKPAIAALLGALQQESQLIPTSENEIGAYGIAQWLASRRRNLEDYAKSKGKNKSDLSLQIDFLLNGDTTDSTLIKSLLSSNEDMSTLVSRMCIEWLRPAPFERVIEKRVGCANNWAKKLKLN